MKSSKLFLFALLPMAGVILFSSCKKACFTPNKTTAGVGEDITFTTCENVNIHSWDFGDGSTSTVESPTHAYAEPGTYTVKLGTGKKSDTKEVTITLNLGNKYRGGIIAYILQAGDPGYDANVKHGLIAATTPQTGNGWIAWDNGTNILTGATSTALGTGNANTNAIVSAQGAGNYPAKMCADLVLNGYDDWYLPSKDELTKGLKYINYYADEFWTSSEVDLGNTWAQAYNSSYPPPTAFPKSSQFRVTAIRTCS